MGIMEISASLKTSHISWASCGLTYVSVVSCKESNSKVSL